LAFVDEATINVRSGAGGNGSSSFHHEPYKPKGGPDGGDGGDGGSVILRAAASSATLLEIRKHPHVRAGNGAHGAGKRRQGARGEDRIVLVPPGTVVSDEDGTVLADLVSAGDELVAARGGRGGRGNARFTSPTRRAPSHAEKGMPGEERRLHLELRLLADVGLVGWPNAGKSTLISRISSARPKIAAYPFTTTTPNLGVVRVGEDSFVVADIPGLVPGAHEGKGMGHRFLRHISRTAVLLYVVDLGAQDRDPLGDVESLRRELEAFDPELSSRPSLIAANKIDIAPERREALVERWPQAHVISAVTGEGLEGLERELSVAVARSRAAQPAPAGYIRHVVRVHPIRVEREQGAWRVRGDRPERAVTTTDFDNHESVARLQRRLIAMGVERALEEAGAETGEEVRIAEMVFEFEPGGAGGES
jgi:GTP-binding protein